MAYKHSPREPIAIIGTGCRFPGDSTSPSKLWDLLVSPRELTKTVPSERSFNADGYYHPDGERHGASNATKSYFLEDDPRLFDAAFFSINPREAEAIDPQQRLLLETVYEAMENAGLSLQAMKGSQTSVYCGAMSADYMDVQTRDLESTSQYMITGTSRALLANRLSYYFDWHGPSIAVDTACSSSLAAIHLGVQSLRNGEATASCVAGSNLIMGPDAYLAATSLHLLSPSGRSQMWDNGADGYARGEGICAFLMKTLSQALKDGDRIDGIIRETCVNSDGRTKGIALPSAEAQMALISTAYENAGLDLLRAEDRPQYIEAHGTGTKAGDPLEARALSDTFFPPGVNHDEKPTILVGSIKTIIGHTEGTAGIAGVLKAILAMRHQTVPPNQHLHNLNPDVAPYYKKLRIPTSPEAWPSAPAGHPLRASVNGFGSGGTNCHAIVESYVPEIHDNGPWGRSQTLTSQSTQISPTSNEDFTPTPLVFSATSESGLIALLEKYAHYLENTHISIAHLALTLNSHRSTLPVRISIPGTCKEKILQSLKDTLSKVVSNPNSKIGLRAPAIEFNEDRRPRILGVFTGQGAQWPGMGQTLIAKCAIFRETIEEMEKALSRLPDPPAWSLKAEIMKPADTSRMSDAELSLPICAAVQVGLVKLLRRAGILFHTVVGHSGGEIGAAYAVGTINEVDAVKIAYYRGIVCKLAVGSDGRRGSMIAVGFGYQEGLDFCELSGMKGRLTVAASNSPKSVTLAGDKDAVMEAKRILDERSLFNRVLQVDTGYHSHHMLPCAEPYTEQLKRCNVEVGNGNGFTVWVSSVYSDNRTIGPRDDADMAGLYWTDNLIGRVLFSQALERALEDERGPPDMILEVGPHPALRGPSLETVRTKLGFEVPYSGVLDRKLDDVTALSNALGSVWTNLGSACVDFHGYATAFSQSARMPPLPDLPTYAWDHKQVLWRESRLNKQVRSRQDRPHELLGSRTPDDTEYEPRWRNFFKLEEMPWLKCHRIQNQIIVPAAAYCVMALEAAKVLGRGKHVKSIELLNVAIMRPIVLDEASEGTETLLSLRSDLDVNKEQGGIIRADFSLSSGAMEVGHLKTAATGEILIHLGDDDDSDPQIMKQKEAGLIAVNVDQFYASLDKIGLNYSGPFKAVTSVERRMNIASAEVAVDEVLGTSVPIHPTWLDVCFQTFLAAFAAPRDGSLWTAFMPTTIGSIQFFKPNPGITPSVPASVATRLGDFIPGYMAKLPTITGDMDIYNSDSGQLVVSVENFTMSSFHPASEKDDRLLYLKTAWQQDVLSGIPFEADHRNASPGELDLVDACEKAIQYYLHLFENDSASRETTQANPYLDHLVTKAQARQVPIPSDTEMSSILDTFGDHIDMKLIRMIGDGLSPQPELDSKTNAQPPTSLSKLISEWHNEGLGFSKLQEHFTCAIKQIAHKHDKLRVLQIGPSSASLVKAMCRELEHTLGPYTIVDGSPEMLDEMKSHLIDHPRVSLHVFDVEQDEAQSNDVIAEGSFDVIIVHKAFQNQAATLKKIRTLSRPGGFLVMMAATGHQLRFPFFLASSPPEASSLQSEDSNEIGHALHCELQDASFSGIDSIGLDSAPEKHTFSVVVSQALDDRVRFLRAPMSATPAISTRGKILILGGSSPRTKALLEKLRDGLSRVWTGAITIVKSLADIEPTDLDGLEAVLSVTELDQAMLQNLNDTLFKNLQRLLAGPKTILWVTEGARSKDPYQSGTIGLFRTFQSENLQKRVQMIDLDTLDGNDSLIVDAFLRLIAGVAIGLEDPASAPLWTIEEEVVVEDGKFFVPRLFPDQDRNRRLNALRRKIKYQATEDMSNVTLYRPHRDNDDVYATETTSNDQPKLAGADRRIVLQVKYCSLDPVVPNYSETQLYCCFGHTEGGLPMVALSTSRFSTVTVPHDWAVPFAHSDLQSDDELEAFTRILSEIKSRIIVNSMPTGFTTLLCNSDPHLAELLVERNDLPGKGFAFVNPQKMSSSDALRDKCIDLESTTSTKLLRSRIPHKTRLLINLGNKSEMQKLSALHRILSTNVPIVDYCDLQSPSELVPSQLLSQAFHSAINTNSSSRTPFDPPSNLITVSKLVEQGVKSQPHAIIVDWTNHQATTLTSIQIQTLGLFSENKTYILVGLTGHIGQSICRWMVDNGARHIVLTSRNPDKNAPWKDELLTKGAHITIEAADVTNKQNVHDLREQILSTMPAIGGVVNGAMVMGNSFFADMSFVTFQKVMAPKVDGSVNLDNVFSGDELEFFVMFSSISAVTGQQGQANYAAANNFMVGLASQRRARNLPASVIDIGMIIGLGFIQRTEAGEAVGSTESALHNLDYMPVSERDLHHLLAEAILAGQSPYSPEIITGLHVYDTGHSPFWHTKALFSHLKSKAGSEKGQISKNSVEKSLKERLNDAGGVEEALAIMEGNFLKYLASSLKLDIESIHTDVPIIDLGIDSLVAVEIRNFIFTETAHDVPVLKILGGSTIKQICTEIVSILSSEPPKVGLQEATVKKRADPVTEAQLPNGISKDPVSTVSLQPTKELAKTRVNGVKPDGNGHLPSPAAPVTIVRKAPLSLGQSRLWFLSQYLKDDTVLNCTISYELSGSVNLIRLQKSIEAVIKRHETLRTVFFTNDQDGLPMQGILQRSAFKLRSLPDTCTPLQAQGEFDRIRSYRYNLETGDTFVATLLSHSTESHTLIFGYHHIIMDGVSWQIFQRDLAYYYDNPMARMAAKPLSTQYIDFTQKQQLQISDGSYDERLRFFQDEFKDPVEPSPLFPFAIVSTRKVLKQYRIRETVVYISADLVGEVKQTAKKTHTTSFHVFLSAFQVLLHRLLDVERICIGMVDANRSDQSFKDVIGFFLETIPVLFHVDDGKTFEDLLRTTRDKVYASLARSGVPTEEILRTCNVSPSSTTETPLFQVCFNYRMGAGRTSSMKGVDVKFGSYVDAQHPFDLVVSVDELDDGAARITFSLQDYLYDDEGAKLLVDTYIHMLETLSRGTAAVIRDIATFDTESSERSGPLGTGRNLDLTSSSDDTLSKIVETWSRKEPDTVAVKDLHGASLTYAQMNERVIDISRALIDGNAVPGTSIAVLLDPCADSIATLLGILRASLTYVPLDVRSSNETLTTILEECGSQVLIYHEATKDRARKIKEAAASCTRATLIALGAVPHPDSNSNSNQIEDASTPDGVAMILFTSGSTGKPKGIPLTNANVLATILGASEAASLGREIVLQQSGHGFDAAVYQIFTALANGGTIIMADNRNHPSETASLMARERVTCTTFIVSEMQAMLSYAYEELRLCSSWRIAMVAGELFTKSLLDQFRALGRPDLEVFNAYGPTEASICTSMHRVISSGPDTYDSCIPIGKAIPNHSMYVVDENCKPVPVGWPGEIVISGPGIASGYLNLPEISATKFMQQSCASNASGIKRIYRTGDRGRMLSDGSIIMSSRLDGDEQVKIRGMRVNLKDVSQAIVQESRGNVGDAVAVLRGTESSKRHLVAFAVMARTCRVEDKQAYIRQLVLELPIPTYMRPVAIVALDSFPMTVRGKLDTQKLASLPLGDTQPDETPEEELSEHEARLRDLWREVLGEISDHTPIRRQSEFFAKGGNSLLLLPLKAGIRKRFEVDLALPQLFQASTLELQAALLAGASRVDEVDWEREIELDEKAFEAGPYINGHSSQDQKEEGVSVLLTGATGFLGTAILRKLVDDPRVARVHCVAIRDDNKGEPRQLKVQSPKIVRYTGDLTLPNLGLSPAQFEDLGSKVDVIIHNGAEVSHMKNYRSLRASNVSSTLELSRIASHNRIPIHYISTGGVARLSGAASQPETSLSAHRPPASGADGYISSKWASEVLLEKINHRFQVPVWIHRPSSVTGDDMPTSDIIHNLLTCSRSMKIVPDLSGSTGSLDFIHVDTVSTAVAECAVTSALEKEGDGSSGVAYMHHCGEEIVPLEGLKEYLEGGDTGSFETMKIQEWVKGARKRGLDELVGSSMIASEGVIHVPLLEKRRG